MHSLASSLIGCVLAVLVLQATASAQKIEVVKGTCHEAVATPLPKYRVAKKYRFEIGDGLAMYLSIAPKDVSRDALFALGCELGRKNAKEQSFHVVFFDDFDGARGYRLHQEGEPKISRLSLRAGYSFDRGKGFHTFSWWPERGNPDRIDVELGSPPMEPRNSSSASPTTPDASHHLR